MTKLLEKALKKAGSLPEKEQDEIAQIILDELKDEKKWEESFKQSQDVLSKLADEAILENKRNKTEPFEL